MRPAMRTRRPRCIAVAFEIAPRGGEAGRNDATLPAVLVSVFAANLATNFAGGEVRGVDVGVGRVGLQQGHQCVEIGCRHGLCRDREHVRTYNRAGYGSTARWASLSSGRTIAQIGAEEHRDAARHVPLAEMD